MTMLKQNFPNKIYSPYHYLTARALPKPFVHGSNSHAYYSLLSMPEVKPKTTYKARARRRCRAITDTAPATKLEVGAKAELVPEKLYTKVKAVVTVEETIFDVLAGIGFQRGIDDIKNLLGKALLLELVSADVDPSKSWLMS